MCKLLKIVINTLKEKNSSPNKSEKKGFCDVLSLIDSTIRIIKLFDSNCG